MGSQRPPGRGTAAMMARAVWLTALVCAVATAGEAADGEKTDGGVQPQALLRMVVPLYMEPGPTWQRLARSAKAHPAVGITAIISPRHEDNAAPMAGDDIYAIARNQTWLDGMAELRSAGVALQHYYHMRNLTCSGIVHSGCTQSSCCLLPGGGVANKHRCCNSWENISDIVDAALHFFPQDGFFNDNGPIGQPAPDSPLATLDDIRTFEARVFNKTQTGKTTPARRPVTMNGDHLDSFDAWTMASFSTATMMYESSGPEDCKGQPFRKCFKPIPKAARELYPPTRFATLAVGMRNGSEMRRWVDGFMEAGYHTLCLLGTEQPEYTTLPSFWEEEVEYLANKSKSLAAIMAMRMRSADAPTTAATTTQDGV